MRTDDYTGKALDVEAMRAQLVRMVSDSRAQVGELSVFGDPLTADDIAHSFREWARVAEGFAARIESGDFE